MGSTGSSSAGRVSERLAHDSGRSVFGEGGLLEGFSTPRRRWPLRMFYILKVSGHTFETGSRLPLVATKINHWLNAIRAQSREALNSRRPKEWRRSILINEMNRGDILSGMFDISADEITAVSAGASVRRYRRSRRAMKKTITTKITATAAVIHSIASPGAASSVADNVSHSQETAR
jgi:hypothetical protein